MQLPSLTKAKSLIADARRRNPTPWVEHSIHVAKAAEAIARHHKDLDPTNAKVLGLLHDIGRREGVTGMRHVLDGYLYLSELGFPDAARICLTHSFPSENLRQAETAAGRWDCTEDEIEFVNSYLASVKYDEYDRLIQLCDALALPSGFCFLEQRFVEVVLRHGFNDHTIPRWKAYRSLQTYFEDKTGESIYKLLPASAHAMDIRSQAEIGVGDGQ